MATRRKCRKAGPTVISASLTVASLIFNQHLHEHPTKGFGDIELDHPTGKSWKDIRQADKKFGIDAKYRKDNNLVWHHHEDTGRMQLIPKDLHNAVRHTGGYAIWSKPLTS